MEVDLEFQDELEKNDENKSYDESCKKYLSNKYLLAHILKECAEEFKDVDIKDIPNYIEDSINDTNRIVGYNTEDIKVSGAKTTYNLLFSVTLPYSSERVGLIVNVEAQNKDDPDYPLVSRAIYHAARLIAGQKNDPKRFNGSEFNKIKKVYSIWICVGHSRDKDDCINRYCIDEKHIEGNVTYPKEDYDLIDIVFFYPNRYYDESDDEKSILKLLSALFSSNTNAQTKLSILENDYDILMTKEDRKEFENMCNVSEVFFDRGIEQERNRAILALLYENCSNEQIMKLGYTEEEIEEARSK